MATHSSILAWGISWPEEPGRLQFTESPESDMTYSLTTTTTAKKRHSGQEDGLSRLAKVG